MCADLRQDRRMASAQLEATRLSAFQEKNSCTVAVLGPVGQGICAAFTVASDMGREGVSVASAVCLSAFVNSSATSLPLFLHYLEPR